MVTFAAMENSGDVPTPAPTSGSAVAASPPDAKAIVVPSDANAVPSGKAAPAHKQFVDWISAYAPASGFMLGALYLCGFIVVNAHLASYGIADFEILRPRIVAAGILFAVLVAIAANTALYLPKESYTRGEKLKVVLFGAFACSNFIGWYALVWSHIPPPILHWFVDEPAIRLGLLLGWVFCLLIFEILLKRGYPQKPGLRLSVDIAEVAGSLLVCYFGSVPEFPLFLWMFAVGVLARHERRSPLKVNWQRLDASLFVYLLPVVTFGLFIYGGFRFEYGGGAAVPAAMYLTAEYRDYSRFPQ